MKTLVKHFFFLREVCSAISVDFCSVSGTSLTFTCKRSLLFSVMVDSEDSEVRPASTFYDERCVTTLSQQYAFCSNELKN